MENQEEAKANKSLMLTLAVVVLVSIALAIFGFLCLNKPPELVEGQVEGTTIRISGKLSGRIKEFYVQEGDTVLAGDTLVRIHSSIAEAQLTQAEAMQEVAKSQDKKVDVGTRKQIIQAAYDLVQQAKAATTITRKTYERMENLYREGVVSEQKRDEAKAAYDAAVAAEGAATSQYDLALAGAQSEDKESAAAMVAAADGGVEQVKAVLEDSYLVVPYDGVIDQIYPEASELVALGSPIMSLLKLDDRYVTFNVREELLADLTMGKTIKVMVPGLGKKDIDVDIYYIRDMGSYATWESTKSTGDWDSRTFQIKARPTQHVPNLRPGMTVIYKK
ncbi:MAG: HlyD family efflux transporter periplasmic adaptor subunit [Bacteroidales bacterium]|nr:HlyD family efflux transporter periplasmic adaptor subunit [Bacteroidales bacterium]